MHSCRELFIYIFPRPISKIYLEFFKQRPQLLSVGKTKYERITTKTTLKPVSYPGVMEFMAGADKEFYTDLSETMLMIKCRYVPNDGRDLQQAWLGLQSR